MQACRVLAGHDDIRRRNLEPVLRVVGRIADQEDEPMAQRLGQRQARPHQRPTDALPAAGGIDGKRAEKESRSGAEPDRPVADRADEPVRLVRHQAEGLNRRDADAVAVGGLAEAVGTERLVEEVFDGRSVERAFGSDHEHNAAFGWQGDDVTRCRRPSGGYRSAARMTHAKRDARRRRSMAKAADSCICNMRGCLSDERGLSIRRAEQARHAWNAHAMLRFRTMAI